ncbi:SMI1/KNR4 family protein [Xanthocytophaga flava]|uniref:SMI1/KNR4 family protein n=1 Tax=Xanthocytophaga flava TaxID=3048013 RepID=UPI0028D24DE5|nr:SMI1/KNR4 family protein [Xanthocytophaga flavus]MDJ1467668.1 SMI1/KNR4 family protein [Xanthocytophaga flavus]
MPTNFYLPVQKIGEPDWIQKLTTYLENYDIECEGLDSGVLQETEARLEIKMPEAMWEYYLYFGGIQSSDFMYNLKKPDEWMFLTDTNWSFVKLYFTLPEISSMIVFSESPGNDPVCFDKVSGEIYLFSHDPLQKGKIFQDFTQYLIYEIMETEKLVGDSDFAEKEEEITAQFLSADTIDYALRHIKM